MTIKNLTIEFSNNFENLSRGLYHKKIALAVSGGVDSVAMLFLMHEYSLATGINLTILTVNHNLRSEAKHEVTYVAELCKKLGHTCIILDWKHQNNFSNLGARARKGRYDLMTKACQELDILTLITAHHFDDIIETFLMKKERKSGELSLSSNDIYFHHNIRILRPLHSVTKIELVKYLESKNIEWMEDISNSNDRYKRNKIRKLLISKTTIYKENLKSECIQANYKAIELNDSLIKAIAETTKIYEYGFAIIDIQKLKLFSIEIKLRLIIYLLSLVSGNDKICRASSILPIVELIFSNQVINKTLHGCTIKNAKDRIIIYRQFGKMNPINILLAKETIWDKRFKLFSKSALKSAYITYLNLDDYRTIKEVINFEELKKLSLNHHNAILFTLPVIKVLEKIVALPHISYYENCYWKEEISFSYLPSFTSRFIHFY